MPRLNGPGTHPAEAELLGLELGRNEKGAAAAALHVAGCGVCTRRKAALARLVAGIETASLLDASLSSPEDERPLPGGTSARRDRLPALSAAAESGEQTARGLVESARESDDALAARLAGTGDTDAERLGLRAAWGFVQNDVVVGCVGNYKPGKGHRELLEVATDLRERFPRLRWCFVGDGPLRTWLQDEVSRRGLDAVIVLHSGERDARHLYGAFDIAVQASDSEGLPNAVLEAAAAGLPIVATAVGGTQEILAGGVDGLLVPGGDRAALLEALARLAEDPEQRRRLGLAARTRAGAFSPARLAEETGALYLRLASGAVAAL